MEPGALIPTARDYQFLAVPPEWLKFITPVKSKQQPMVCKTGCLRGSDCLLFFSTDKPEKLMYNN
jgi:hypothetical protein